MNVVRRSFTGLIFFGSLWSDIAHGTVTAAVEKPVEFVPLLLLWLPYCYSSIVSIPTK